MTGDTVQILVACAIPVCALVHVMSMRGDTSTDAPLCATESDPDKGLIHD